MKDSIQPVEKIESSPAKKVTDINNTADKLTIDSLRTSEFIRDDPKPIETPSMDEENEDAKGKPYPSEDTEKILIEGFHDKVNNLGIKTPTKKVPDINNTADKLVIGSLRTSEFIRDDADPIEAPSMDEEPEDTKGDQDHSEDSKKIFRAGFFDIANNLEIKVPTEHLKDTATISEPKADLEIGSLRTSELIRDDLNPLGAPNMDDVHKNAKGNKGQSADKAIFRAGSYDIANNLEIKVPTEPLEGPLNEPKPVIEQRIPKSPTKIVGSVSYTHLTLP